jgi:cardiolipin synthase
MIRHMTIAELGTLYYASEWAIRLAMLVYVPQRRSAAAARTWLLLIFLMPWPGLLVYALLGRIRVSERRLEKLARASRAIRQEESRLLAGRVQLGVVAAPLEPVATLAFRTGDFPPFAGNDIELIDDYAGWISRLVEDIDGAQTRAHLLFYIFGADATAQRVAEALSRAAGRGVECHLLIDAVGGEHGLAHVAPSLRASGVDVRAARPAGLFRRNAGRFDLRNHRKIAIIDGRVAHTGSQNITNAEFVPGFPNEELMARVTGPVVTQLEAVFLADWFEETDQRPDVNASNALGETAATGMSVAQVLPSGPGYPRENARDLFIALLYAARTSVVITTPYFIPDEPFLQALESAATRGVDVHLIVSKHANQPFSQFAQRSYYQDILASGVHVHLYRPRFLHAKHLTVDDAVAVVGSTNIDIRSFALNAEVNLIVFDPAVVGRLRRIQQRYLAESDQLDATEWSTRSFVRRTAENVARLADSLL